MTCDKALINDEDRKYLTILIQEDDDAEPQALNQKITVDVEPGPPMLKKTKVLKNMTEFSPTGKPQIVEF